MAELSISVSFQGPFSARPGTLEIDVPNELKRLAGLYLWTVSYEGGYLVNYVGKTKRPFSARFRDHRNWYRDGKDILDPDCMPKGENWLVENPTPELIIRFLACYRVFLAPLDVDDATLVRIESAIIQKLLSAGGKCSDFLGNKQKRVPIETGDSVGIQATAFIHGLGTEVAI
jgi:hypothetical protein